MLYKKQVKRFFETEEGATAIEYALLIGGLVLVVLAAVDSLLGGITGLFQRITDVLG